MKPCPTCGEPVAMRGNAELPKGQHGWVTHDICPHPCHAAAQAVLDVIEADIKRHEVEWWAPTGKALEALLVTLGESDGD